MFGKCGHSIKSISKFSTMLFTTLISDKVTSIIN